MNGWLHTSDLRSPRMGWFRRGGQLGRAALSLMLALLLAVILLGASLPLEAATGPQMPATQGSGFRSSPPGTRNSADDPDYLWTISGVVRDNGGAPVQGAAITTSPEAIGPAMSDADGAYAAYVDTYADTYAASVAKDGYGILPSTTFTRTEEARVDFVLPPADNVVANWGFETGSLEPDWQTSGLAPAMVTNTLRHTGAQGACLGQPDPGFTTPVNISNLPVTGQHWLDMIPDGAGGVHMLWRHGTRGSPEPVYYAWRTGDGTWIVPPGHVPQPDEGFWMNLAVGPDGVAHIAGLQTNYIIYSERPPGGSWSDPLILNEGMPRPGLDGEPQIAVAADNSVPVVWNNHYSWDPWFQRIFGVSRDASGTWTEPRDISGQPRAGTAQPSLAVDQTGGVHVVWVDGGNRTLYACRAATGPWSRSRVIREGYAGDWDFAVEADGRVHVVWYDGAFYRVWYAQGSCQGAWSTPEAMTVGALGYPPSLAVDRTGTVHMLWTEWLPLKLQYARRLEAGSWSVPQTLTGVPSYNNPRLALDDSGTVHAVWTGGITGWGPETIQVYYTSRKGDAVWSWPRNISNAAQWLALYNDIQVLAVEGNGRVHAGWSNGTNEVLDVYYASSVLAQETGDSTLSQRLTVPGGSTHPMLSFMYELGGVSPDSGSSLGVSVNDGTITTTLSTETYNTGWTHRWLDLQPWAGQTVTLTFTLHQVAGQQPPWACLDEVTVGSAYPDTWVSQSGLGAASPGQKIVDVITHGNRGGVDASNGQVTLQLPPGLTFVSADPPPSQMPPNLAWDVGDLAAHGDPHTISTTLQVLPSVPAATTLTATAAITSETAELEQANNSDDTSVYVVHRVNLPMVVRHYSAGCLVYSDGFSDPASGWPIEDVGTYAVGYADGEYRVLIRDDPWESSVYVWGDYGVSDYRVEVDVHPGTHLDGEVGLVFWTELGPYVFAISDGQFGLWRASQGTWTTAVINWTPSPAIRGGSQTNRLGVARSGDRIMLFANGQYVGGAIDNTPTSGLLALWTGAFSSGFEGRFDNFALYANTCPTAGVMAGARSTMSVEFGNP
jgi:uncharacterized repeat protein (TIGR01451 family)